MVKFAAQQLRANNYKKGDLPYGLSVGDIIIINWTTLVAGGLDIYAAAAAEETIISTTSDDMATQEVVKRIIEKAEDDQEHP
jgi:hypothetical protein